MFPWKRKCYVVSLCWSYGRAKPSLWNGKGISCLKNQKNHSASASSSCETLWVLAIVLEYIFLTWLPQWRDIISDYILLGFEMAFVWFTSCDLKFLVQNEVPASSVLLACFSLSWKVLIPSFCLSLWMQTWKKERVPFLDTLPNWPRTILAVGSQGSLQDRMNSCDSCWPWAKPEL